MPSVYIGVIAWIEIVKKYFFKSFLIVDRISMLWRREKTTMLFIFHAKLKRGVQKYVSIKQRQDFVIKMDESSCQIIATVFTLAKSYGSYSAVFSKIL